MKNKKKRIKTILIAGSVAVVLAAGFFIYRGVASAQESAAVFDAEPAYDKATKGDISLSVSGSGNLDSASAFDIDAAGISSLTPLKSQRVIRLRKGIKSRLLILMQ